MKVNSAMNITDQPIKIEDKSAESSNDDNKQSDFHPDVEMSEAKIDINSKIIQNGHNTSLAIQNINQLKTARKKTRTPSTKKKTLLTKERIKQLLETSKLEQFRSNKKREIISELASYKENEERRIRKELKRSLRIEIETQLYETLRPKIEAEIKQEMRQYHCQTVIYKLDKILSQQQDIFSKIPMDHTLSNTAEDSIPKLSNFNASVNHKSNENYMNSSKSSASSRSQSYKNIPEEISNVNCAHQTYSNDSACLPCEASTFNFLQSSPSPPDVAFMSPGYVQANNSAYPIVSPHSPQAIYQLSTALKNSPVYMSMDPSTLRRFHLLLNTTETRKQFVGKALDIFFTNFVLGSSCVSGKPYNQLDPSVINFMRDVAFDKWKIGNDLEEIHEWKALVSAINQKCRQIRHREKKKNFDINGCH